MAVADPTKLERLRADLDDLAERHAESVEALALAEVSATEAEARQEEIVSVDADEFTGAITTEEADTARSAIRSEIESSVAARDRLAGITRELEARLRGKAEEVAAEMGRIAQRPVLDAHDQLREARKILELREREVGEAEAGAVLAAQEIESVLVAHDPVRAQAARERDRAEEEKLRWAVQQGSETALLQLSPSLRPKARERIEARRAELLEQRRSTRRREGLPEDDHPRDAEQPEWVVRLWD